MKKIFFTAVFLFSLLIPLAADEPLLDPADYTVYSKNENFFLSCNFNERTTSCYEIPDADIADPVNFAELKWQIPRWTSLAFISDSGDYCILDEGGADGLLQTDFTEETALFSFYEDGNLLAVVRVRDIYDKPVYATKVALLDSKTSAEIEKWRQEDTDSPLKITVSHYEWGHIEKLDDSGILLITTEGAKWFSFDSKKIFDCLYIRPSKSNASCNELKKKFDKAKNLISNMEDREKLSYALETIIRLSKNEGYKIYDERYGFDLFWDEGSGLKIKHAGGPYKGAGGHNVKTAFYFKTKDSSIHFFLTDDTSDLYINISGGGKKSPDIPGAAYRDDNPNRFYDFNTKKKSVRTMDYYSD